jgi:hypothetical protein
MADRLREWPHKVPSALIDTFFCHIEAPDEYPHEYYNPHYNGYGVKYQLVVAIGVPAICSLSISYKGLASDALIAEVSGVYEEMDEHEAFLADKSYRGDPSKFVTPCSGHRTQLSEEDKARNYLIYRARQTVERVIKRLRVFGLLHQRWRYSIELHELCTMVICQLVNFLFLLQPLG